MHGFSEACIITIIIPQVSFSQSDCSICGQYDVILPFLTKKISLMPFSSWNVNKQRVGAGGGGGGGGGDIDFL